jgi:hypothetical protein
MFGRDLADRVKALLLLEPAPGSSAALPAFVQRIRDRLSVEDREALAALDGNPASRSDPELYKRATNTRFKADYCDPGKQDLAKMDDMDAARVRTCTAATITGHSWFCCFIG